MVNLNIELPENFFDEEIRCDYTVSSDMKKVWAVELDLLNEFMKVCKKNNIEFFASGGTILGAVRHGGFIPWDDDIDLMMTRDNYEKLCKCAPEEFSYPYFFQTELTDKGSLRGHAQLRNSETTGILVSEKEKGYSFNQGIFIDIFPLDFVPDDKTTRERFFKKLKKRLKIAKIFALCSTRYSKTNGKGIRDLFINIFGPLFSRINRIIPISVFLYNQYEKFSKRYNKKRTGKIGLMPLATRMKNDIWDYCNIENGVEYLNFEFLQIPVPKNYIALLDDIYGNWREFVMGGAIHGGVIFDTEKPYIDYLKR